MPIKASVAASAEVCGEGFTIARARTCVSACHTSAATSMLKIKCLDLSGWKCVHLSGCIFCSKTSRQLSKFGVGLLPHLSSSYILLPSPPLTSPLLPSPPLTSPHLPSPLLTSPRLFLPLIGFVSGSDDRVTIALEELQDLKGVWSELGTIWEKIEELREKPWLSVAPRKIRQALDALLQQLRAFPSRLKQYASFDYVQTLLKGYTKVKGGEGGGGNVIVLFLAFTGTIFVCTVNQENFAVKEFHGWDQP